MPKNNKKTKIDNEFPQSSSTSFKNLTFSELHQIILTTSDFTHLIIELKITNTILLDYLKERNLHYIELKILDSITLSQIMQSSYDKPTLELIDHYDLSFATLSQICQSLKTNASPNLFSSSQLNFLVNHYITKFLYANKKLTLSRLQKLSVNNVLIQNEYLSRNNYISIADVHYLILFYQNLKQGTVARLLNIDRQLLKLRLTANYYQGLPLTFKKLKEITIEEAVKTWGKSYFKPLSRNFKKESLTLQQIHFIIKHSNSFSDAAGNAGFSRPSFLKLLTSKKVFYFELFLLEPEEINNELGNLYYQQFKTLPDLNLWTLALNKILNLNTSQYKNQRDEIQFVSYRDHYLNNFTYQGQPLTFWILKDPYFNMSYVEKKLNPPSENFDRAVTDMDEVNACNNEAPITTNEIILPLSNNLLASNTDEIPYNSIENINQSIQISPAMENEELSLMVDSFFSDDDRSIQTSTTNSNNQTENVSTSTVNAVEIENSQSILPSDIFPSQIYKKIQPKPIISENLSPLYEPLSSEGEFNEASVVSVPLGKGKKRKRASKNFFPKNLSFRELHKIILQSNDFALAAREMEMAPEKLLEYLAARNLHYIELKILDHAILAPIMGCNYDAKALTINETYDLSITALLQINLLSITKNIDNLLSFAQLKFFINHYLSKFSHANTGLSLDLLQTISLNPQLIKTRFSKSFSLADVHYYSSLIPDLTDFGAASLCNIDRQSFKTKLALIDYQELPLTFEKLKKVAIEEAIQKWGDFYFAPLPKNQGPKRQFTFEQIHMIIKDSKSFSDAAGKAGYSRPHFSSLLASKNIFYFELFYLNPEEIKLKLADQYYQPFAALADVDLSDMTLNKILKDNSIQSNSLHRGQYFKISRDEYLSNFIYKDQVLTFSLMQDPAFNLADFRKKPASEETSTCKSVSQHKEVKALVKTTIPCKSISLHEEVKQLVKKAIPNVNEEDITKHAAFILDYLKKQTAQPNIAPTENNGAGLKEFYNTEMPTPLSQFSIFTTNAIESSVVSEQDNECDNLFTPNFINF